ncbi:MAG: VOC family protein [Gammaproteobacteria bacterium]|nr:VOC family protein [Gammaproteobacteria bacterium]
MSDDNPLARSKPSLDIGYFTNDLEAMLAFWQVGVGLAAEEPVEFNDGLTQYRHALGTSVLKVNTARGGVATAPPTGYRELLVARAEVATPRTLHDPDGNPVTLVPPGHDGITGVALRLAVADAAREGEFLVEALGCAALATDTYRCGDSLLFVEQDRALARAGHWVNAGLRYVTLHVMRVDAAFAAMVAAGAEVGEEPYSIGRIARISFVRDPHGNWFEVAQRAALAGPWWAD